MTTASYIHAFLTQYCVAPLGHIQAVPPFWGQPMQQLSPFLVTRAGNDFTRREWAHTIRQRPPSTPGRRSAESQGSASVCVWNVCEGGLWSIVSGQRFEWLMFSCERSCGMSGMCDCPCTCVCFFLFRKACVCVCVRTSQAGGDIWHGRELFWSSIYVVHD